MKDFKCEVDVSGWVAMLFLAALLFICVSGCQSTETSPIVIQPSAQCQATECADSQICKTFNDNPDLVFSPIELGLVALIIEEPTAKPEVNKAYTIIKAFVSKPNITYAGLAQAIINQFGASAGKWAPLVMLLGQKLSLVSGGGVAVQVSECDRKFLLQHCQNVLGMVR